MLVSDMELRLAKDRFAALYKGRYSTFDEDAPATARLAVRLPAAAAFSDVKLSYALHALPTKLPSTGFSPSPIEVRRFSLPATLAGTFNTFDHPFPITDPTTPANRVRVLFYVSRSNADGVADDFHVGTASLVVSDLVGIPGEKKSLKLEAEEGALEAGYGFADTKAEFSLEWMNSAGVQLVLEMRIKVQRHSGWPFSNARPFFVMYTWDAADTSWAPLYRSEVLTKESNRSDADGSMIYEMSDILLGESSVEVDDRPLRIELFHYKMSKLPKLIGFLSTSLRTLRCSAVGTALPLDLKTFMSGELVGSMHIHASKVTLNRHFFSLQINLGGEVPKPLVCLDVTMKQENKLSDRKRFRPRFLISRYSQRTSWQHVYQSEQPSRRNGKGIAKYKMAKFSEAKLIKGDMNRKISLLFYHDSGSRMENETEIGHMITTMATLLESPAGTTFALAAVGDEDPGYVVLSQGIRQSDITYLEATCVLGRPPPPDSIRPLPLM